MTEQPPGASLYQSSRSMMLVAVARGGRVSLSCRATVQRGGARRLRCCRSGCRSEAKNDCAQAHAVTRLLLFREEVQAGAHLQVGGAWSPAKTPQQSIPGKPLEQQQVMMMMHIA